MRIVESGVTGIGAGSSHSLFIKSGGALWTMGRNTYGQLGDNNTTDRTSPVKVHDSGVTTATGGEYHSLFVTKDGSLWGMGMSYIGSLGEGGNDWNQKKVLTPIRTFGPPRITAQPTDRAIGPNDSLIFSVTGDGGSLAYQWYKEGTALSGATQNTYQINSVTSSNSGNYHVIIRNAFGAVSSRTANLSITTAPAIATHPVPTLSLIHI